ncbi:C-C chemokine receptor type 1-like [Xiphias gladius]|uniref:C-C chemokine receptor type 1-like n=1 Tax=Xiphias gladius TaxID=8245 RepID=UPI001A99D762|nr:C-C chemokine receptor type 1-like [Xiphias gladius]
MSDPGPNTTITPRYDYAAYYDENYSYYSPCNDIDGREFGRVFLPTLYSLVFGLGFLGNGLVVCVLVKHRNQTNLTDICLFNLALSDLLFVLTLPFYAHYSVVSGWTFGDFMCRFISTCNCVGFFSSIFFMVVMTLDRYMVIMHTQKVARYRSLRAGIVLSMIVWLLSLCVSVPDLIFTKVTNGLYGQSCNQALDSSALRLYNILSTNILGLVIPLLVMVVCYSRIIPILVTMRSAKRHRVVKLIISIVAAFFLFWAPYNISIFLRFLQVQGKLSGECNFDAKLKLTITVTETFAYTHCCLNPIIYAFVGQKFMKKALQMLSKWMPWIHLSSTRSFSDSSFKKSSVMSRSSDVTPTIM